MPAWFIDEEATEQFRRLIRTYPAIRETARYRVCIMNETLERAIADGVKQVVTLGAGFDMRAHIFRTPGVRFCDVDQPAVLAFKRKVLEARGVAPCAAIPGNYLEIDLPGELAGKGFDLDAPTLFIWEGNTMYLPVDLIHDFLERLRAQVPRAHRRLRLFLGTYNQPHVRERDDDGGHGLFREPLRGEMGDGLRRSLYLREEKPA